MVVSSRVGSSQLPGFGPIHQSEEVLWGTCQNAPKTASALYGSDQQRRCNPTPWQAACFTDDKKAECVGIWNSWPSTVLLSPFLYRRFLLSTSKFSSTGNGSETKAIKKTFDDFVASRRILHCWSIYTIFSLAWNALIRSFVILLEERSTGVSYSISKLLAQNGYYFCAP